MKQLDFAATEEQARQMSVSELWAARLDCLAAAEAADDLERAGCLGFNAKSGGYYRDEGSTYARELARRGA